METLSTRVLTSRKFWPLLAVSFLGAFNDNICKASVSVLIAYGIWKSSVLEPDVVVSLAALIFILPFIIFTPFAGYLADRIDKAVMIRRIKLAEIGIMLGATVALLAGSIVLSLIVLFGLGVQSAFYSPVKLSILPQHLKAKNLIAGNAYLTTGTYLAILTGSIAGSGIVLARYGVWYVVGIILVSSVVGFLASLYVPEAKPTKEIGSLKSGILKEIRNLKRTWDALDSNIRLCIIGVSWFFTVGMVMITQLPNLTAQVLYADRSVLIFFMILFSLGVGIGGICNKFLYHGGVKITYVPWALAGLTVACVDLYLATHAGFVDTGVETAYREFLATGQGVRVAVDFFFVAMFGGLFVVPLEAYIQDRAPLEDMARVQAVNSFTNAVCIVLGAMAAVALLAAGLGIADLFLILGVGTVFICAMQFYSSKTA